MGWKVHQMDVKTALLNEVVEEEIYVEQPEEFETFNKDTSVCRLKRVLYGLKLASRAWYARIDSYLLGLGFTKSEVDPNLYYIVVEGQLLILVLYVDDLILRGADSLIQDCKEDLAREFEMKDLGLMHYFLRLEVWQGEGETFLGQGRYVEQILRRFHMQDCRAMATPLVTNWKKVDFGRAERVDATLYMQLIGSLMYLTNTFFDISFAVNQLSQFMVEPTRLHWVATKHVLLYLLGTTDYGLWYRQVDDVRL
jgi:hypothetical protein